MFRSIINNTRDLLLAIERIERFLNELNEKLLRLNSAKASISNSDDNQLIKWDSGLSMIVGAEDVSFADGFVGINEHTPLYGLDIIANTGNAQIRLSDNSNNNTIKNCKIVGRHYDNTEEPVLGLQIYNNLTDNRVTLGGTSVNQNTATVISFYTAINTTTLIGTLRFEIDSNSINAYLPLFLTNIKSGATQAAAGAAANEVWKTSGHASLPDNVLMIGV